MRIALVGVVFALSAAQTADLAGFDARRRTLSQSYPDCAIAMFAEADSENHHLRDGFTQEPNFYYLTGWTEPGAILLIEPERHVLFLPPRNSTEERWSGPRASSETPEIGIQTGFPAVLSTVQFETELRKTLERIPHLCSIGGTPQWERLSQLAPLRTIRNVRPILARMRMVKSADEVNRIRYATAVSVAGHRAAWKRIRPGLREYQLGATLTSAYLECGCERPAYMPIIGSGPNTTILHYVANRRRMDRGELVLIDSGAECGSYTSDITRTIPVSGKFTRRQRELYEVVLGAQKAVIAAVRPGTTFDRNSANSLFRIAFDYIDSHGTDQRGDSLGRYFNHGIGHHVGLEVHDAFDPAIPLAAGMVITIEPGIYVPDEGIGIRIEDVVLVTEKGAEVLSSGLPKEVSAIERALGR